jgi:hypothetical protein
MSHYIAEANRHIGAAESALTSPDPSTLQAGQIHATLAVAFLKLHEINERTAAEESA